MIGFREFFNAIHGYEPFRWQAMLAEQVLARGRWPKLIDLPTASGKTAAIDVAVWALANDAHLPPGERRMPCRIWFVVDRRIVVDAAAERALKIQRALLTNTDLKESADALRRLSGTTLPLAVDRLRGGLHRDEAKGDEGDRLPDDAWQHVPSQPAVITSTVDQLGSRLLFRGYGMGRGMWPIHAALAGNDSLILLDEAHIAEPMRQTLDWVERHRTVADEPVATPWHFAVMTATPQKVASDEVFPAPQEREAALDHPLLHKRRQAGKRAKLVLAEKSAGKTRKPETLVPEAITEVKRCLAEDRRRIAVMVNRVDTALAVEAALSTDKQVDADVRLLTGRMRPVDREALMGDLQTSLLAKHDGQGELDRPIVLVTTQCLEVGADFDFDGLVTECASLDALRQRFGRLDRLGQQPGTTAAVLAWRGDIEVGDDPIYGTGLAATWQWLWNQTTDKGDERTVDFGIDSLNALIETSPPAGGLVTLVAPTPNAPVLLPAYLDAWCQRAPAIEPEVSLFLHGIRDSDLEVSVVFRADLAVDNASPEALEDAVKLVPPVSGEMLPVRLGRLLGWLSGDRKVPADTDLSAMSGGDVAVDHSDQPPHHIVRYRGRRGDDTEVLSTENLRRQLQPGDVLVVPWAGEIPAVLGRRADAVPVDCFELANTGRPMARLSPALVEIREPDASSAEALAERLRNAIRQVTEPEDDEDQQKGRNTLTDMVEAWFPNLNQTPWEDASIVRHPMGGVVLVGPPLDKPLPIDPFGGEDDTSFDGNTITLADHAARVADIAASFATACLPTSMTDRFRTAGLHHDDGKTDPRFQALLRGTGIALPVPDDALLAKSNGPRLSPADQRRLRQRLGLPDEFRHEMLSMRLAEKRRNDDLLLHLIAAHHGYARPFAPVAIDDAPPDVTHGDVLIPGRERRDHPPHALASGVADRFWRLNRRYGWWGLAYLEAILRLADHHVSRFPAARPDDTVAPRAGTPDRIPDAPSRLPVSRRAVHHQSLLLRGLDGTNPLAVLAALGTLKLSQHMGLQPRLAWSAGSGGYQPLLWSDRPITENHFVDELHQTIQQHFAARSKLIFSGDYINWSNATYRDIASSTLLDQDATSLDQSLCASLAAETSDNEAAVGRSAFSFANGQSGKKLLFDFRALVDELTVEHLDRALFHTWHNDLPTRTLQWEPGDFRPYALRADNPADARVVGEPGANALAFYGLSFLPTFPRSSDGVTAGMRGQRSSQGHHCVDEWVWPLWTAPLEPDTVQSLLLAPLLYEKTLSRKLIAARDLSGVVIAGKLRIGKPPTSRFYFTEGSLAF